MRVGLFGGTFNPPHVGHRIIAEHAVEALGLDRLIWIPAGRSPHKDGTQDVAADHRLEMVRLAAAGNPCFSVSDIELDRPPPSYTVDTLRYVRKVEPKWDLVLLVGLDSWRAFDAWKEPEVIQELATIAVYPRLGTDTADSAGAPAWLDAPLIGISSTQVRARIHSGKAVRAFLDRDVLAYIRRHSLYIS